MPAILNTLGKYKYPIGLLVIVISLVVYKLPFLTLPYYWDEAWPYSVGVHAMFHHGLSLMPGAVPPFIARGHPLMFHFLAALWMKLFGTTLLSGHSFALLVSVLTVAVTYKFCKTFFSERIAFTAALLLISQAVFISQSAFLMPEMLMALWTMICFYHYFKGNKILFIVFTTCMLLTKESGAVFIATIGFSEVIRFFFANEKSVVGLLKKGLLILTPVLIASAYFIIQKIRFGWFLFPFYMNYISSGWTDLTEKFSSGAAYIFIYYGRNAFSFLILVSIVIFIRKKIKFSETEKMILPAFSYFIVFFLLFSSINYFIERYLLCAFPPFIIIGTVFIDRAFSRIKFVYPALIFTIIAVNIYFYTNVRKGGGDMDYSPSINVDKQVVSFCEQQNLYTSSIFAPSVLRIDFSEPVAGYLSGKPFANLHWEFFTNTEYCIFSSDEYDGALQDKIKNGNNLKLIQRFQDKYAWREIYKVMK